MVEVTKYNFDESLNELEHAIEKCSFFSIDCEYTSLPKDFSCENSFFDSGEHRYLNWRDCIGKCIILQVGITPFRFYRDLNHFKAKPFNFYVFPEAFGHFNATLLCKSTTIQFLCDHKFNFNKVFYDGISYMNQTEKKKLIKHLHDGTLLNLVENTLSYDDTDKILRICEGVKKWSSSSSIGDQTEVACKPYHHSYNYVLREELCLIDKDIWTTFDGTMIKIKKIDRKDRLQLENAKNKLESQENYLNRLTGFSKVFDILTASKKPLVGHNLYLDLLAIYHQFYENLPGSYNSFKKSLNSLFPEIYDTKFLAFELNRLKSKDNCSTSLGSMFESYQDKGTVFHFPHIMLETKGIYNNVDELHPHDAGWDSYMTGFIFLKMADEFTRIQRKHKYLMNVTTLELFSAVAPWKNLVCLARARVSHVNLNGNDPPSKRPPLLHVSHYENKCLGVIELDAAFKKYEPFHKKTLNVHSALIAVPNFVCFKRILVDFSSSTEYKVEKYSLFRHHRGFRACLIAGVFVPVVVTMWFGLKPN